MAKVTTDVSGVSKAVSRIKGDAAFGNFLAIEAMKGMSPYVPMRNGYLDASAKAEPWAVTYSTSYARRVYYGDRLRFSTERHANASAHWDEPYAAAHGRELADAGTRYLRRMA